MQKKLLTVAVAGALGVPGFALAQSSVEVYGTVNLSAGNVKYTASGGAASLSKWDVANHASNYGFRGRESFGGGLTGWFQIEQNAPMERSNNAAITPASRNSAVGIQGGFGNIFIGQWTTPWADLDALWGVGTVGGWGPITSIIGRRETTGTAPNYTCGNIGHGVAAACESIEAGGGAGHPFWRRASQSIHWQSPVWAGVQAKVMYQTNEGKSIDTMATGTAAGATLFGGPKSNPDMWSASLAWSGMGGRARVGAAFDRHKEFTSTGTTDTGWRTTGGFNFGFMDVGLAYEQMSYKCNGGANTATNFAGTNSCGSGVAGDVKAKQYGIGVAVPVGSGVIRGSYAIAKDLTGPANAIVGPSNAALQNAVNCPASVGATHPAQGVIGCGPTGAKTYNVGYEHRFSKRTQIGVGYAKIDNEANAAFAWTGLPGTAGGGATGALTMPSGVDVSTFFVNMTMRF